MNTCKPIKISYLLFFVPCFILAQSDFNIDDYKNYLNQTSNMTYEQLSQNFPAGYFKNEAAADINSVQYMDSVDQVYHLTEQEKELLKKHSFVVTERITAGSFLSGFHKIYNNDLPLYISSDAILNALHMSYDAILKEFEEQILIPKVNELLGKLHEQMGPLQEKYSNDSTMQTMLQDLDIYLTVPYKIFNSGVTPFFETNEPVVDKLLKIIGNYQPKAYALFSSDERVIDFSQFRPRGHYNDSEVLSEYFKVMMWLGRIEIYLTAPKSADTPPSAENIRRQLADAVLVCEAVDLAGAQDLYNEIEQILLYFIGESDNVTLNQLLQVTEDFGLQNAAALNDTSTVTDFQSYIVNTLGASQKILSHILYSDPQSPDQIEPATSFLLFGQRFVIDSYVMGNVVYDRVIYNGIKVRRMLPSSLDVLFALGNDAALQLLDDEIHNYPYVSNLTANRYLIDAYDPEFWQSSLYNSWLEAIRTLAPAKTRDHLPRFMQTAAWNHKQINTQCASWAQLRHDNLLYAKQSYSGGVTCDFPATFVEPVPEFYKAVADFAQVASKISEFVSDETYSNHYKNYFKFFEETMDTLQIIAQKELDGIIPDETEQAFLKNTLFLANECGRAYSGWYAKLNYSYNKWGDAAKENDMVIADVHTAPTDENGSNVGWVMHVGTGPLNMAVIISDLPTGEKMAFCGPVISYYEHVSTNYRRLTDEEWQTLYNQEPSIRPDFVNLYLADQNGNTRAEGRTLLTDISEGPQEPVKPETILMAQNYPNPFNGNTTIAFAIPAALSHKIVDLTIFDIQGRIIRSLLHEQLPAGSYSTRWDGLSDGKEVVASGLYFYRLKVGNYSRTGKMQLTK